MPSKSQNYSSEGPDLFLSGRIFPPDWPETSAMKWQHIELQGGVIFPPNKKRHKLPTHSGFPALLIKRWSSGPLLWRIYFKIPGTRVSLFISVLYAENCHSNSALQNHAHWHFQCFSVSVLTVERRNGACTKSPRSLTAPVSKTILHYLGPCYK